MILTDDWADMFVAQVGRVVAWGLAEQRDCVYTITNDYRWRVYEL